jgi:hypothetical protein
MKSHLMAITALCVTLTAIPAYAGTDIAPSSGSQGNATSVSMDCPANCCAKMNKSERSANGIGRVQPQGSLNPKFR